VASDLRGLGERSSGKRSSAAARLQGEPRPGRHHWGAAHGRQERRSGRGRRDQQACGGYARGPGSGFVGL